MNNSKCCIPYVCASSGHKWACERHDIGTQCGATATNIAAQTIKNFDANSNQQKFQKTLRQLEVVSSAADGYQNQPAAFVPSKVSRWKTPPYMKILIPEHYITPIWSSWMLWQNSTLYQIQLWMTLRSFLIFELLKWKSAEKWKLTLEEFSTLEVKKVIFD